MSPYGIKLIQKYLNNHNTLLIAMIKNGLKQMNPVGLEEDCPLSDLRRVLQNPKELYQITETTSLDN